MAADVAPRHAEVLAGMAAGTIGVSAGARFLGPDVLRTRYHRTYQRIMRPGHQGNQLPRAGSRHKLYPCCGRRRNQCVCDWSHIEARADPQAIAVFADTLVSVTLLRATDTTDTGHFLRRHQEDVSQFGLRNFMMLCIAFRRFGCVETWEAMMASAWLPRIGNPSWEALAPVLRNLFDTGCRVFGGLYYPATLRSYRLFNVWNKVDQTPAAERELLTLQLLWACLVSIGPSMAEYEASPSGQSFKQMCMSLMDAVKRYTKGCFGDYHLKLLLDLLVCSKRVPSHHMLYWPTSCPGYAATLKRLFPGLHPTSWLNAVHYLFRYMGQHNGGHLNIAEVAMHLCWDKRRKSGVLGDHIDVLGRGIGPGISEPLTRRARHR